MLACGSDATDDKHFPAFMEYNSKSDPAVASLVEERRQNENQLSENYRSKDRPGVSKDEFTHPKEIGS